MESFFSRLKVELIYAEQYETVQKVKSGIFEYIEVFYNRLRRHSSLGGVSPAEFERNAEMARKCLRFWGKSTWAGHESRPWPKLIALNLVHIFQMRQLGWVSLNQSLNHSPPEWVSPIKVVDIVPAARLRAGRRSSWRDRRIHLRSATNRLRVPSRGHGSAARCIADRGLSWCGPSTDGLR